MKFQPWVYDSLLGFAVLLLLAGIVVISPLWTGIARLFRRRQEEPVPELGIVEYINRGSKLASAFGSAAQPINVAFSEFARVYKKYASQYGPLLQSRRLDKYVRAEAIYREMARELKTIFEAIDEAMPRLEQSAALVAGGFKSLALEHENNPDQSTLRTSRQDITAFLRDAVERLRSVWKDEFLPRVVKLRGKQSDLTAAATHGAKSINDAIKVLDEIADSCRDVIKTCNRLLSGR